MFNTQNLLRLSILFLVLIIGFCIISARGCPKRSRNRVGSSNEWAGIAAPSSLTATAFSSSEIRLSWLDNSNNEDGFEIESRQGGTTQYSLLATVSANTTSYSDPGPFFPFTTYYYRVRARNSIGDRSAYSNEASAITIRPEWQAMAAGESHSLALNIDSTIWGWGNNLYGQLGLGDNASFTVTLPTQIGSDTDWNAISAGYYHSLAIKTNNTLWSWGGNDYGELGLGDTDYRTTPSPVGTDSDWRIVEGGSNHSLGIKTTGSEQPPVGTLWSWGLNDLGQLGLGYTTISTTGITSPNQIGVDSDWSLLSAGGADSFAIKTNSTLWAWGYNYTGQLGDGTFANRYTPRQIGTTSDWSMVSAGYIHTIALKTTGTLWQWGQSVTGPSIAPTQIGTDTDWSIITAGGTVDEYNNVSYHSLAIKTNSTLWAWGTNTYGQLGLGDNSERSAPTQLGTDSNWVAVAAGGYHSIGRKTDGALWVWGGNNNGQLGIGNTVNQIIPINTILPQPGNFIATAISTTQINLSWTDNSPDEIGYKIDSSPSATGPWTRIATPNANETTYQDSPLTPNTTYYYQICSSNGISDSGYASANATTLPSAPVNPPSQFTAIAVSSTQITLTWQDVPDDAGYKIYSSLDNITFSQIATPVTNDVVYYHSGLTASTTYYYRITAYNASGETDYASASAMTVLNTPNVLTATVISLTQINLDWTNVINENGYKLERGPSATGPWSTIVTPTADTTTYQNIGLTANTTYYYRVRAYDAISNSAYSNIAVGITTLWIPQYTTITPSERYSHSMVSTGTGQGMIMFGGIGSSPTYKNDLWWYYPASGTNSAWIQKTPASSPSARYSHSMVWNETGQRVIMFGGFNAWPGLKNDLWWYDPTSGATGAWIDMTTTAISPTARRDHSMVWDPVGQRVIMFGGFGTSPTYKNDLWWYYPVTNTWEGPITTGGDGPPTARNGHSMVWDPAEAGRVIMFGGYDASGNKNDLWWYDPGANTWTQKIVQLAIGSPSTRTGHSMVWDPVGQRVIMFGGSDGSRKNDLWWYYPVTNTWIEQYTTVTPSVREYHSMVWDPVGQRVIMFGGINAWPDIKNDLWWYYPVTNTWVDKTTTDISPTARYRHSMVWDTVNSRVIMFGGITSYKNDLWWYDTVSNTWTVKTPINPPSARYGHSMVWNETGQRVIMFGGRVGFNSYTNDLWWYDPGLNTWTVITPTGGPPSGRYGHSMVWDGARVIMFGGRVGNLPYYQNDLWWYDPGLNTWTVITPTGGPPSGRYGHSMVWDPVGQRVIMFGGSDGSRKNDLWWYYPGSNTWESKIAQNAVGSPSARYGHSMVWDTVNSRVIMFGGMVGFNSYTNDLWLYYPGTNTWTGPIVISGSPLPRQWHSMVWNTGGQRVIMFGGYDGSPTYKNDLWWWW